MDAIDRLDKLTYQVEHNPNCPMPYLVRIVTIGTGGLDKLPTAETKDTFAYGKTLGEAASRVLSQLEIQTGKLRKRFSTL